MPKRTVNEELSLLRDAVEDLTGLPSRWSGQVVLMDSAEIFVLKGRLSRAEKLWSCDILVNVEILDSPARWRTFLHEMLHSVSVGANDADFRRLRGWEEAVVEWTQRQLRPQVLRRLGLEVAEEVFTTVEKTWPLNGYLAAMHELQQASGLDAETFYSDLLHTPLAQRLAYARSLNEALEYRRLFANIVGRLR